jgi:hypothetical protein
MRLHVHQFLFIYPINGLSAYSPAWYLMRVCPESETRTRIEMEYYKHKSLTDTEMDVFVEFGKQVQQEVRAQTLPAWNGVLRIVCDCLY